jgi:hypothetical protein
MARHVALAFMLYVFAVTSPPATAAAIKWQGGSGNWSENAKWEGGVQPDSFAAIAGIDSGNALASSVALTTNVSIGTLTIDISDTLNITAGSLAIGSSPPATAGLVTNNGIITVANPGAIGITGPATIGGSGRTVLQNTSFLGFSGAGSERLTIGPGHTLAGTGMISVNSLTNNGTLVAEAGSLRVTTSGSADSFLNSAGSVQIRNSAELRFNSTIVGGELQGTGSARVTGGGFLKDVTIKGTVNANSSDQLGLMGTIAVTDTLRVGTASSVGFLGVTGNVTLAGAGRTSIEKQGVVFSQNTADRLTIGTGHTLAGSGTVQGIKLTNQGSIVSDTGGAFVITATAGADGFFNRGLLSAAAGSSLTIAGASVIQDAADALTRVDGTLTVSSPFQLAAGMLKGNGAFVGQLDQTGGTIAPGASVGQLTIQGSLTLGDNASLQIEINGTTPGTLHDALVIAGNAALNGNLVLSFGYTPKLGDSFVVLTTQGGVLSGGFDSISVNGGIEVAPTFGANQLAFTVTAVPEPQTYALMALGLGAVVVAARARRRARV